MAIAIAWQITQSFRLVPHCQSLLLGPALTVTMGGPPLARDTALDIISREEFSSKLADVGKGTH